MFENQRTLEDFSNRVSELSTRELRLMLQVAQKEVEKRDKPIISLELKDNILYFNSDVHTVGFEFIEGRFINKRGDKIILNFPTINKLFENFTLGQGISITKYDLSNKEALVNTTLIMMLLTAFTTRGYVIDTKKEVKNGENAIFMKKQPIIPLTKEEQKEQDQPIQIMNTTK